MYKMRKVTACIIKNNKGEVLLQKKTLDYPVCSGCWAFFGGHIESNESVNDAIVRELKEEIGIKISPKFLFNSNYPLNNRPNEVHVFLASLNDLSKISLKEGAGFSFFSKEELKDIKLTPDTKVILNKFFEEF